MKRLTAMQRRYVWLAGSFPSLILVQGQGKRTRRTLYRVREDEGELVVFGYSYPPYLMGSLLRKLQAPHSYVLTEEGERLFREMLASGAGLEINRQIREVSPAA